MAERAMSATTVLQAGIVRWLGEITHQGIFATDANLCVIAWNRWMERHTHLPADEVLGRPLLELYPELASRDLERCFRDALNGHVTVLSQGLHRYLLAMPATHPELEQAEMPQSCRVTPLVDEGRVVGTITTIDDVSERLASEAALRTQIDAHRIARDEAESALRAKDEFLSILSHELRQPLNAVLGWTRILMARKDTDVGDISRALQVIDRNAMAQASMIDDILDVARVASGKLRLKMKSTDVSQVVLAAIDVIAPAADAKQLTLRTRLDPRVPRLLADSERLQQIAWNLLSNAVKFSDPGDTIDVSLALVDGSVRLIVADSGRGISPDFLPYMFDRFRQSDPASTRRHGGLGLGLALVRDLVHLHGGTIRAESAGPGRGAAFIVDLPTKKLSGTPADGSDPEQVDADGSALAGVRALVVEADAAASERLVSTLARYGATATAVASAAEALEIFESTLADGGFDVIVSGIGMARPDGDELMRAVRERDPERGGLTPAVAMSGDSTQGDRTRALAAGYQMHVAAPVDPDEVVRAVARVLGRHLGR